MSRGGPHRMLKLFPQAAVCAEESQPDSDNRYSQAVGDLLRRIVQHIAKQACLPQIRGKLHDRFRKHPSHLAARAAFFGIMLLGGNGAA